MGLNSILRIKSDLFSSMKTKKYIHCFFSRFCYFFILFEETSIEENERVLNDIQEGFGSSFLVFLHREIYSILRIC